MERVLVLGGGYTAMRVLARARSSGSEALAVVRRSDAADALRAAGITAFVQDPLGSDPAALRALVDASTHLVVTFPPDDVTDARAAAALPRVGDDLFALTYLSATSVYGDHTGVVDDTTPVTVHPTPAAARRLAAEAIWRERGATVLRCPAIYGPDRGAHVRIARGEHRIPGDGSSFVSRIHVEDLAALVLAAPRARGETFVVGDLEPSTHHAFATFVSETRGVPMPASVPLETLHESLRGNRRVDPSRALRVLDVTLAYPSYRTALGP